MSNSYNNVLSRSASRSVNLQAGQSVLAVFLDLSLKIQVVFDLYVSGEPVPSLAAG